MKLKGNKVILNLNNIVCIDMWCFVNNSLGSGHTCTHTYRHSWTEAVPGIKPGTANMYV